MAENIIEISGLRKSYNGVMALKGISFCVREGDVCGLVGPNGAGKTTTLRILATMLPPDEGAVMVAGHDIIREPLEVRRVTGFMPETYGIYDNLTVEEYLDLFASLYGIRGGGRRRIVKDVMELTDLGGLRERLASSLSKGMKQRLCLARALVHNPRVLILDEPASGLDPRARIEFRALLKELRNMGKTILISSHILTELSDVCNAVTIIEKGEVVAAGEVGEITRSLTTATGIILSVLSREAEAEEFLKGNPIVGNLRREEKVLRFDVMGDEGAVAKILGALMTMGIPVLEFTRSKTDLETVFMRLTRGEVT